ncbi:MAG: hypothetical protein AB9835_09215 [Eubacteriales bacterium]
MKRCVSCNTENADDAVFCSDCGLRFGEKTEDSQAALSMPETGTSAPEEIRDDESVPPVNVQSPRLVIPPTPEAVIPKDEAVPTVKESAHPQYSDDFTRATQQFQAVPPQRVVYDPSGDIKNLRLLYKLKYPALGILAVILKIIGWLSLALTPILMGFVAAFPAIFQSYMNDDFGSYYSSAGVVGAIIAGLITGALSLLSCYATAAVLDFIRDREREGRIHTDILLRTLNKK